MLGGLELLTTKVGSNTPSIVLVTVLSLFGASAYAQDTPKVDIFAGYSYVRDNPSTSGVSGFSLNGGSASIAYNANSWLSGVADFGGYHSGNILNTHTSGTLSTYLFGPRVSVSVGKIRPFAHALFGAGHVSVSTTGYSASDTAFAEALGGGFDYKLVPLISWRFQGDYLQTRFFGNTQNNGRFSTGIVLNF
jgi:hypothetical protein